MHLERTFEKSTVEELVNLYSTAIEYYNTKDDDQALNYQLRMQKMLKRPEVLRIFSVSVPKEPKVSFSPTKPDLFLSDTEETAADVQEKPVFFMKELETPRSTQATAEVKKKEISDRQTGDKLADSLKNQENDLETRIKRRKIGRALSGLSFVYSPANEAESPKAVEESFDRQSETGKVEKEERKRDQELEAAIQDIMERSYEEKSAKIAEITVKYTAEINSMEDSGVMGIIVNQMKQNMQEEIELVSKEFDEKRRFQVKTLKEEFASRCKSPSS
jgi:hypothetical protein